MGQHSNRCVKQGLSPLPFVMYHRLADIAFLTESDSSSIRFDQWELPQSTPQIPPPDVLNRIRIVTSDDLCLPPLTADERQLASKCVKPPSVGPDTLLIPPLFPQGVQPELFANGCEDPLDVALLRAPAVRSALRDCLSHAESVALVLHSRFIAIYDYQERLVEIFHLVDHERTTARPLTSNGVRRLFASMLPVFGGLMVHSSALLRGGRCALFLAPDEGGKSTAVALASSGVVLSDDRNIIRRHGREFWVHGTPWGTKHSPSHSGRLCGLFILEKSSRFALLDVPHREVLQFLWDEHLPQWHLLPTSLRQVVFDLMHALTRTIPCYTLRFSRDFIDWRAVDAAMQRA